MEPTIPPPALKIPSKPTLKKYGLNEAQWALIADQQNRVCFVCHHLPSSGILHIDHEHVRGWKKLRPEARRQYVRGLLCFRCNTTYAGRAITIERAQRVVSYLERYASQSTGV